MHAASAYHSCRSADFVGQLPDMHLASTKPGSVRGNHLSSAPARSHRLASGHDVVAALGRRRGHAAATPQIRRHHRSAGAGFAGQFPRGTQRRRSDARGSMACSSEPYDPHGNRGAESGIAITQSAATHGPEQTRSCDHRALSDRDHSVRPALSQAAAHPARLFSGRTRYSLVGHRAFDRRR